MSCSDESDEAGHHDCRQDQQQPAEVLEHVRPPALEEGVLQLRAGEPRITMIIISC